MKQKRKKFWSIHTDGNGDKSFHGQLIYSPSQGDTPGRVVATCLGSILFLLGLGALAVLALAW